MSAAVTLLRTTAEATPRLRSFGHGPRAYSNLDQINASIKKFIRDGQAAEFPQVWVHPVTISEEYKKAGTLDAIYSVLFVIATNGNFSASPETMEETLNEINSIRREYVLRITKAAAFDKMVGDVTSEPIYHHISKNLIGYLCRFKMTLKENFVYPC
jgi:hypothetical protein